MAARMAYTDDDTADLPEAKGPFASDWRNKLPYPSRQRQKAMEECGLTATAAATTVAAAVALAATAPTKMAPSGISGHQEQEGQKYDAL